LFNLSRTIELLKRNSELSIVNEFSRNDTLASHTQETWDCSGKRKLTILYFCLAIMKSRARGRGNRFCDTFPNVCKFDENLFHAAFIRSAHVENPNEFILPASWLIDTRFTCNSICTALIFMIYLVTWRFTEYVQKEITNQESLET